MKIGSGLMNESPAWLPGHFPAPLKSLTFWRYTNQIIIIIIICQKQMLALVTPYDQGANGSRRLTVRMVVKSFVCMCVCVGVLGDQCLTVRVMSVRGKKLPTYVDHLPLNAKSTLASLG